MWGEIRGIFKVIQLTGPQVQESLCYLSLPEGNPWVENSRYNVQRWYICCVVGVTIDIFDMFARNLKN